MRLLETSLLDFRNLAEVQISFAAGVNVLLGANGQGKTNVLEALNYPALARSFRGARDEELVRFQAPACHVKMIVAPDETEPFELEYGIARGGERHVIVDGEKVSRRIDLVGRISTVVFDPQTVELVRGGPSERRRWLDQGISSIDREYLEALGAYQRALRQKARLLRDLKRGFARPDEVREDLRAWNRELSRYAAPITLSRVSWLARTAVVAREIYAFLSGSQSHMELTYNQPVTGADLDAENGDFEQEFLAVLEYIMGDEIKRGRCLSGPHADDVEITLDHVNLRTFGSRGETRTAAISLKLAQAEIMYRTRRERPILFFDDIFSELDRNRVLKLQERTIADHQVFIATARAQDVAEWRPGTLKTWLIDGGVVSEQA